jgi:hypothetical protein
MSAVNAKTVFKGILSTAEGDRRTAYDEYVDGFTALWTKVMSTSLVLTTAIFGAAATAPDPNAVTVLPLPSDVQICELVYQLAKLVYDALKGNTECPHIPHFALILANKETLMSQMTPSPSTGGASKRPRPAATSGASKRPRPAATGVVPTARRVVNAADLHNNNMALAREAAAAAAAAGSNRNVVDPIEILDDVVLSNDNGSTAMPEAAADDFVLSEIGDMDDIPRTAAAAGPDNASARAPAHSGGKGPMAAGGVTTGGTGNISSSDSDSGSGSGEESDGESSVRGDGK